MIANYNIVCLASSWDAHPTSKQHVMRLLAEQNHVVWVNYHASRRPQLTAGDSRAIWRRLRKVFAGPRRVAPTIDVLSPLLLPLPESPGARRFNAWMLLRSIRHALRRLPSRPTQLWLFTPDIPELIRPLNADHVLYYCVDDFAEFAGFNRALVRELEAQTLREAHTVIATSQPLVERLSGAHPAVHFVPHGVDADHFGRALEPTSASPPADLAALPAPRLGFFGLISDHVDVDLLAAVARRRPDWSLILVGDTACDVSCLAGLPNVHRLGRRDYAELPDYCRGFDIGLIPFRQNELVRAVNPIKLREYLAAGLPVASTPMPEVERYAPAVQTGAGVAGFTAACAAALARARDGDPQERHQCVAGESWRSRVEQLSALVQGNGAPRTAPAGAAELAPA